MQGSPPRRTRRRPPKKSGPTLPLVPIVIGVIVLGFVIGAGISVAGRHDPGDVASPSPTVAATIPPARPQPERTLAVPTDSPIPSSTVSPSASPSHVPSPRPSRSPSPLPSTSAAASASPSPSGASPAASASASPVASASAQATPSERPSAVATPAPPKPHPSPKPTTAPTPESTQTPVAPVATAVPATATPISHGATTSFAKLAASVVRVYLASVQRGDRDSAAAELASPPSGALAEDGIVDSSTEVRRVDVHGTGDVVTVDVDLHTAAGSYAAQYTVRKSSTGAAVIVDHSIVKS